MEPHPENLKPFTKGDPRINRNGRPKSFDALRKLAQQIAAEIVPGKSGQAATIHTLNTDGSTGEHVLTVAEGILRSWATSGKPELQKAFIEVAFGKSPTDVNLNVDLSSMTDDQLERIAKGENVVSVVTTPGKGRS